MTTKVMAISASLLIDFLSNGAISRWKSVESPLLSFRVAPPANVAVAVARCCGGNSHFVGVNVGGRRDLVISLKNPRFDEYGRDTVTCMMTKRNKNRLGFRQFRHIRRIRS